MLIKKTKIPIKLSNGQIIPRGTKCEIEFTPAFRYRYMLVTPKSNLVLNLQGRDYARLGIKNAHKYFGAPFTKPPSIATLQKWDAAGIARTVTGHKTEPDGTGPDGSPSWMLILSHSFI
jgi:hypothetical protein